MASFSEQLIHLFLWVEDFDNPELDEFAWATQLMESVDSYNEEYSTDYDPMTAFKQYTYWQHQQLQEE